MLRFRGVKVPISDLPIASVLIGDEAVPLVQDDQTRQAASGDFITEIPPGSITNTELADMAQDTIKGRADGAGTGSPQDLTAAQVVAIIGPTILTLVYPVTNANLATMTQGTVKGRTLAGGTGTPVDLTPTELTTIVASILLPISNSEMDTMTQGTVKGRTLLGGTGTPVDLTPTEITAIVASILLPISNSEMDTMAESTIKGRAAGAGTGTPQDLTAAQVVTLIGPTDFIQGATFARGAGAIEVPVMDVDVYIAQACEIRSIVILADPDGGDCVVDIYRAAFGAYPPTNTIFSGAMPTISGGDTYSDSVLTGVSKNNAAGDVLRFHLVSSSVFQRISIFLVLRKL